MISVVTFLHFAVRLRAYSPANLPGAHWGHAGWRVEAQVGEAGLYGAWGQGAVCGMGNGVQVPSKWERSKSGEFYQ